MCVEERLLLIGQPPGALCVTANQRQALCDAAREACVTAKGGATLVRGLELFAAASPALPFVRALVATLHPKSETLAPAV